MRIGIGAILGVLGGPATYARELIRALARIDDTNEYVVITDAPERLGVQAANVSCVHAALGASILQPVWDHGWVPFFVHRQALQLYHGTKGMLPIWNGCPEVVTIHDLAVYHQPETFAWSQRLHQLTHTPLAVRRATRVIADSESGRRDILERFSLPPEQVVAIPLAAGSQFSPAPGAQDDEVARQLQLPSSFLLYAGTIQPRKNVELLVEAFSQLPPDAELVVAGRVRPGYQPAFLRHPPARVRYLGPVSDAQLAVLYRRAIALCSPSSYEGFGLSLLEAMRSGCAVIAGANSSVPEVVGDAGILLDEISGASLRQALLAVLGGKVNLDTLREKALRRAAQFSWDETARRTLAVYREVLEDARAAA